jgi:hypothetical protein
MNLVRAQGMNNFGMSAVFNALMSTKMLYASQDSGRHLHVDE